MNTGKLSLLMKIFGISMVISGLLCLILKLCSHFNHLCKQVVDEDDDDRSFVI